jgi:hypothetical protein
MEWVLQTRPLRPQKQFETVREDWPQPPCHIEHAEMAGFRTVGRRITGIPAAERRQTSNGAQNGLDGDAAIL